MLDERRKKNGGWASPESESTRPGCAIAEVYQQIVGLKTFEEALRIQEEKAKGQEEELRRKISELEQSESEIMYGREKLREEWKWIELEVEKAICRDVVYEIIFKAEEVHMKNEEESINKTKPASLALFEKTLKSLNNFQSLKDCYQAEAQLFLSNFSLNPKPKKPPKPISNSKPNHFYSYSFKNLINFTLPLSKKLTNFTLPISKV
jgi:hypothetical protein